MVKKIIDIAFFNEIYAILIEMLHQQSVELIRLRYLLIDIHDILSYVFCRSREDEIYNK